MGLKSLFSKIKQSKWYNTLKTLITLGGNSKFAPSSLTFFIMVSLVPIITSIVLILSFFGYNIKDVLLYLEKNLGLGTNTMNLLEHYFLNIPSFNKVLFGFGIFILIYISSKGITFFTYAYQKINNIEPKYDKFFSRRIWGIFLSIISEVFLAFLIIFLSLFDKYVKIKSDNLKTIIFSFLILLIIFLFLTFIYSISSTRKVKFKEIVLGSGFSSIAITIGMSVYIYYLDNYSNASNYYGSLTSFILLLLIIYYSSYITLLGVQINYMFLTKRKKNLR